MQSVNLLPASAIATFRRKKAQRRWFKCVVFALGLAALTIVGGQSIAARYRSEAAKEELAASPSRLLHRRNQQLRGMLVSWKGYESKQLANRSNYSPLQALQLINDLHQQVGGQMQIDSFDYVDSSRRNAPKGQHGTVALQIVTEGTYRSARIIQLLRDSDFFIDAKLNSALQKVTPNADDLRFSMECSS